MKTLTFFYEHRSAEQYRALLEFLCKEEPVELVIYSIFSSDFTGKEPEQIDEIQRQVAANRRLRFRNHGVFHNRVPLSCRGLRTLQEKHFSVELFLDPPVTDPKPIFSTVKKLGKRGISLSLWNSSPDQRKTYETYRTMGLPVCFLDPEYSALTEAWFDEWAFDKKAVSVNTFTDIMAMILMGTRSHNCRHGSCVGNTYYVDGEGRFYLCPLHPGEKTCLGTMEELGALSKSYEKPATYGVLLPMVAKREKCISSCQYFPLCHGGCPLEGEGGQDCSHYAALAAHIAQVLRDIWEQGRLGDVNPVIRSALLNAIAFDSAFIRS